MQCNKYCRPRLLSTEEQHTLFISRLHTLIARVCACLLHHVKRLFICQDWRGTQSYANYQKIKVGLTINPKKRQSVLSFQTSYHQKISITVKMHVLFIKYMHMYIWKIYAYIPSTQWQYRRKSHYQVINKHWFKKKKRAQQSTSRQTVCEHTINKYEGLVKTQILETKHDRTSNLVELH